MPIKRELRWFYPIDWPEISRRVRFERAGGVTLSFEWVYRKVGEPAPGSDGRSP